jgi:hypothetical protein
MLSRTRALIRWRGVPAKKKDKLGSSDAPDKEQLNLWVSTEVADIVRLSAAKERRSLGEVAEELIRLGHHARTVKR